MTDNDHFITVVRDISFLYEIALSVGQSLSLEDNCAFFLKRLMERKGLGYGSIWIYDCFLTGNEQEKGASLVYAHPDYYPRSRKISRKHPLLNCLKGGSHYVIDSTTPGFVELVDEEGIEKGSYMIVALQEIGVLKLFSFSEIEPFFDRTALIKTEKVMTSFVVSLKGCLSHQRVVREIEERKKLTATLKESEENFRFLVENLNEVIYRLDDQARVSYVSPNIETLSGYTVSELLGRSFIDFVHPDDQHGRFEQFEKIISGVDEPSEYRMLTKDGREYWVRTAARPVAREGRVIGIQGALFDITDRKHAEEALKASEEKYREILATMEEGYYEVDLAGNLVFFNDAFRRMAGLSCDELLGKNYRQFYKNPEEAFDTFNRVYKTGLPVTATDWHVVYKDGREAYVELSVALRHDEKGEPVGFRGVVRDITQRRQTDNNIRYLSFHDHLTGLYNRHYLEAEMERLDTERQLPISIVMADLNGLKLINDTYGHSAGDAMLKRAAMVLKKLCRGEDLLARYGGDEFVLYMPRTPVNEALKICNRIDQACRQEQNNDELPVSLTAGVAVKVSAEQKLLELLKEAEDCMYQNKLTERLSGKSSVVNTLLETLAAKSHETEKHTRNMQEAANKIGVRLGLPDSELRRLNLLVTLHDIGKINVPEELLRKKGALADNEWDVMKRHCETGYRIARASDGFAHVAEDILAHHERWDSSGYPQGLKGDAIPILARIVAIADAYEVMSSGRPYKKAMSRREVVAELKNCSGTQFDPDLVKIFLSILRSWNWIVK